MTLGSICDTFHDSHTDQQSNLPKTVPLTLANTELAIVRDETQNSVLSYPTLEKMLVDAFSSVKALNSSFSLGQQNLSYSHPNIDYSDIGTFYTLITSLPTVQPTMIILSTTLSLLKRPKHKISLPSDIIFLLIILENPILHQSSVFASHEDQSYAIASLSHQILERSIAILAHSPKVCRHFLLNWVSRFPTSQFQQKVEIINALITHRLSLHYNGHEAGPKRKHGRSVSLFGAFRFPSFEKANGNRKISLLPRSPPLSAPQETTSQRNLSPSAPPRTIPFVPSSSSQVRNKRKNNQQSVTVGKYGCDWRILAFARLQAIFFNANIISKKIPVSLFYNTIVDYIDIKADFDAWELLGIPTSIKPNKFCHSQGILNLNNLKKSDPISLNSGILPNKTPLFAFCQYPFMISMGGKTQILEYDAYRQMTCKAQEAFFSSITTQTPLRPYLHVKIRRTHLLQDSFEFLEAHEDDLKKAIRVEFVGEPGIDVGGLRKEWFLLLIRELFNTSRELFNEDENSRYCWFNINSNQPLKYYKLVGVTLGLALYNSTILDAGFPPILYARLLGGPYNLKDFTKLWPLFGSSLQTLLDYEGDDFDETFSLTFSVTRKLEQGGVMEESLITNGSNIPVTKSNRLLYVKKIIEYYLESSVKRQFEPLKLGFYKAVGSNALTLFQPEEIELLIQGSNEPLDIPALRSVTRYNNWAIHYSDPTSALVVRWFWAFFSSLEPLEQRKLLMFVTGSDRIPATGISTMLFTITRLGSDCDRFPVSHTCFNELCLYEYKSKSKLISKLSRAINESEGFGLK